MFRFACEDLPGAFCLPTQPACCHWRKPVLNQVKTILAERKRERNRISMLTAYDWHSAVICDQNGVDIILVGDSLGQLVQASEDSKSVTMTEMVYHTAIVSRGVQRSLVFASLPFGSYEDQDLALNHARLLVEKGGAHGVQMQGRKIFGQVHAVASAGIAVMGLAGMDPELVEDLGPYSPSARKPKAQYEEFVQDCLTLEKAGCAALMLKTVPATMARHLSTVMKIPVIGMGAGRHTDGQVLYFHDMMGITDDFRPRHVKRYAHVSQVMVQGVKAFLSDVEKGHYPGEDFEY